MTLTSDHLLRRVTGTWAVIPVLVLVVPSCLTLCDPMDCTLPGSSVNGILQARTLEWVAMPSSRGSSKPGIKVRSRALAGRFFITWATKEAHRGLNPSSFSGQAQFPWEGYYLTLSFRGEMKVLNHRSISVLLSSKNTNLCSLPPGHSMPGDSRIPEGLGGEGQGGQPGSSSSKKWTGLWLSPWYSGKQGHRWKN